MFDCLICWLWAYLTKVIIETHCVHNIGFLRFQFNVTFWAPCCDVRYDFCIKTIFDSSLPPVVCRRAHVTLFEYSGVQHILYCIFVLFFFRLVYHMLPVSLDCPFLIAPSVFSNVYLHTCIKQIFCIAIFAKYKIMYINQLSHFIVINWNLNKTLCTVLTQIMRNYRLIKINVISRQLSKYYQDLMVTNDTW